MILGAILLPQTPTLKKNHLTRAADIIGFISYIVTNKKTNHKALSQHEKVGNASLRTVTGGLFGMTHNPELLSSLRGLGPLFKSLYVNMAAK